jgi:transposase
MSREELLAVAVAQAGMNESLTQRVAWLERQLKADSTDSSRPPSSDAPWAKKPAKKRSARSRSGRKPGKQPGAGSVSRRLVDDPDAVFEVGPDRCQQCAGSLAGGEEVSRVRRQVVDASPPPPPVVTEYQVISRRCGGCGHISEPTAADVPHRVEPEAAVAESEAAVAESEAAVVAGSEAAVGVAHGGGLPGAGAGGDPGLVLVLRPGSPVRIGAYTSALVALLTCGHYLPVVRAAGLLGAVSGIGVSTGFVAGVRGRAAALLEVVFLPHMRQLLQTAPVLHADETCGRAAGALAYVHVACTEYLTVMHVGGRSAADIDAGGVLAEFTGTLVRDGYSGYAHLPAIHAWCAAHYSDTVVMPMCG